MATLHLSRRAVDDCSSADRTLRVTVVPTFAMRWLAPRLARYEESPGAAPVILDVSAEIRSDDSFDIAIRTGLGDWQGLYAAPLLPVEATPMLSPALAATMTLSSPADLARLPLFRTMIGLDGSARRGLASQHCGFMAVVIRPMSSMRWLPLRDQVSHYCRPRCSALIDEGKLLQPFAHVLQGPNRHHLLLRPQEERAPVLEFASWLPSEAVLGAARA